MYINQQQTHDHIVDTAWLLKLGVQSKLGPHHAIREIVLGEGQAAMRLHELKVLVVVVHVRCQDGGAYELAQERATVVRQVGHDVGFRVRQQLRHRSIPNMVRRCLRAQR